MATELKIGHEEDGYRYIGGDPADDRSWESMKVKVGTVEDGYRYLGGDPASDSNWQDVREPGLIERIKEGARNTASFLKASATDDSEELAKIVAERQRTQLPVTAAGVKVATDIRKSADQMESADADIQRASAEGDLLGATRGVINSTGAGMLATGAKSLLTNPKETLGMIAENLPNSAPGLAGGLAGAAVGAATPVPGGAVIGGVVGGTAGGYNVEMGGALYDQILKEAKDRGIDPTDEKALASIIAEKKAEFVEKARLKGIGTAGTDAVLNAITFGAAGAAERTLVRSANQIGKRVADGTIDAATGAAELAALEAKNAARNTLGSKLARGTAVTASEMAGESASEYAGQKLAYGEADPTDVLLEGLLGAGQGVAMASGRGLANKAGEAVGLDNYTDVDKALAQNSALVEASRQREAGLGDIMGATDVGSAVDAAVKAADLDLQTSLVPELASDIDAYNAASLRAPALNPSDALELAAAKGAMDRVGSLDLSQPAAINAPASEITAAGDNAAREVEAAGGVATPAQAAMLDRAFPGQKMYDQVVGSSEQAPTVSNNSPIITEPGRAPRETVSFANPLEAENAEGWKRFAANQKQAAQTVANEATSVANQAPQVNVNNVISALQTTPGLQTAEQRVTLNAARQNLSPEDFQLLETAAVNPGNLSAEQQIRLRFMEKQGVSPQNQETPVSQENQATLSAQRTDEQETQLPQAELVYSPTKMGEGYRLVGTQNVNGREMFVYADESVAPNAAPNNNQLNQQAVPEMGTNVPNMGTTEQATETFTPKQGVATLESTATGNDEVGSTGTVNSDGRAYQYTVVESGVAPGVSGAIRQLARLFGKKVVFFNSDLAADGFVQPGKGSAIYINANSKMSPMAVFGHELMHLLKRDNPIAYKAVAAVVGRNLKGDAASNFRDYYNAAGPNQNSELTDAEMEEMVADLMGNEFTQESFLSDVFNEISQIAPEGQARSIILRLAATINKAVKAALNVIKGMPVSQAFQTEQMVNNLEQIRASLKSALKEYAIQQKESAAKMAMEFTREESSVNLLSQGAEALGEATLTARRANETIGEFGVKNYKDGTMFVQGEAEQIRNMLPDGVVGRPVPGGVLFSHTVAPRVKAALDENKLAYSRAGQVIDRLPMKDGKYVGAPEKFNTPGKIATLRKWLRTLADEGAPGRFWYENSGREVLKMVGGDVNEARKFVALLAIYSPQAKVDANSTFALRAWAQYKAGQPISVKTGVMDDKAKQALDDVDAFWSGEKTGNFFNNLLREIDLSTEGKQGATIDMWMMRAGQYDTDAPTATQYAFMENETNRLAQELGWEPQQVQAAIWVAMKARMENGGVKKSTEATSEKKKWIRFDYIEKNGKKVKQRVILDEKKHRDNWLKHAFSHDPSQDDTEQAKFDFGDGLKRHIGQVSFEARPGRSTGVLPGIHDATYEQQVEFQIAVQNAFLEEDGSDRLAQLLGLMIDTNDILSPGVWQGEVSPSSQKLVAMAPAKGDAGKKTVDPAQAKALNAYAAIRGLIAYQEGVGWHRAFYSATKRDSNGVDIDIGRPLSPPEAKDLAGALDEWMLANAKPEDWNDSFAVISSGYGVRLVNFGVISNKELHSAIIDVAQSVLPDFNYVTFASDGDMPTNNWKEFPNGQSYIQRASTEGSPDVLGWSRDVLAPRVATVFKEFSDKYGWGNPGNFEFAWPGSNESSGESGGKLSKQRSGEVPGYGVSTEGSISVRGHHYSKNKQAVLDGRFFGTGIRSQEYGRVRNAEDKRLKERIYFYIDSGKGIKPEAGTGANEHVVDLNNVYDAINDKRIQRSVSTALRGEEWSNAFESAVLDAGYDGYVAPFGNMKAAVLIGRHAVDMSAAPNGPKKTIESREAQQIPREELVGRKIEIPVFVEETGQTATISMDAKEALDDVEERESVMESLLECLAK